MRNERVDTWELSVWKLRFDCYGDRKFRTFYIENYNIKDCISPICIIIIQLLIWMLRLRSAMEGLPDNQKVHYQA